MKRIILHHQGQAIPLAEGETLVGRGLECRLRFNDPAVSRVHLRIISRAGEAVAENLSHTNGTLLNAIPLVGPRTLKAGDEIRIGYRRVVVALIDDSRPRSTTSPQRADPGREASPGSGLLVDEEQLAEEATRPGEEGWRQRQELSAHDVLSLPTPRTQPIAIQVAGGAPPTKLTEPVEPLRDDTSSISLTKSLLSGAKDVTCPRCRAKVSYFDDACQTCGYEWPPGRPSSRTQEINLEQVSLRAHPRYTVEVPVVYSSESLTIDAIVRDISRGGMFIASDLLDPIDTPCELTALPDGHEAVSFTGLVAHVVTGAGDGKRPSGLGIRFTGASPEASRWLEHTIVRYGAVVVRDDDDDE